LGRNSKGADIDSRKKLFMSAPKINHKMLIDIDPSVP
jgi:hypothetical protein